jgi:glycosyltransferase involved in cell wall biosynthesis
MPPSKPNISVITAVFNEEQVLRELYHRLNKVLESLDCSYEIIFVDDGSKDTSWVIIQDLNRANANVRGVKFTRNFGQHVAITAGLDHAEGDYVVVMDADLQDEPEVIPRLLERCKETGGVVYALRRMRRDSSAKQWGSKAFYYVLNSLSSFKLRPDVGVFRVMPRAVRDNIVLMREQTRIITGLIDWLGFPSDFVEVDRPIRAKGSTKYNMRKLTALALQGIMTFSNVPLRFATYLGFLVSTTSFIVGAYFLFLKIFFDYGLTGWPSLITAILFLGGVQLLVIGILGEYIGRVFIDVKNRPLYVISKKI